MVDRREHGLGAVAGDPLFVEAKEIPLIEASVTKVFEALSAGGINIQMISTSEIKTAVILEEARIAEAANLVHAAFGLGAE